MKLTDEQIVNRMLTVAGETMPADPEADDTYFLSERDLRGLIEVCVEMVHENDRSNGPAAASKARKKNG